MIMKFLPGILLLVVSTASAMSPLAETLANEMPMEGLPNGGKLWALLVAGSNGFINYRHQADVCHAYQIVRSHGIPDENIVVMMYDDIAYNKENKMPGTIINRPDGPNVYVDVPKDYIGSQNNPHNFLLVLEGVVTENTTKVIKSGPKDHVFVYFADHGAPGVVAFPESFLTAKAMMQAIQRKHLANGFNKMVFYVEACESGSMFKGLLPDDIGVFATTAANSTQSSYACYFDSDLGTFLGDVYSVKWLEDSDSENLLKETLEKQFEIVRSHTDESQVCQFGDLSIAKMPVADFQGMKSSVEPIFNILPKNCGLDQVKSGDVPLEILRRRMKAAKTPEELAKAKMKLERYLEYRKELETKVRHIVSSVTLNEDITDVMLDETPELTQHDCYYEALESFHELCYNLGKHEYALRLIFGFANLCESGFRSQAITDAIRYHCTPYPIVEIN